MDDKDGRLKDLLHAQEPERRRQDDSDNIRKKKKQATIMYRRRKLDKDIKWYTKYTRIIKSKRIDKIGNRHGFYITETYGRLEFTD